MGDIWSIIQMLLDVYVMKFIDVGAALGIPKWTKAKKKDWPIPVLIAIGIVIFAAMLVIDQYFADFVHVRANTPDKVVRQWLDVTGYSTRPNPTKNEKTTFDYVVLSKEMTFYVSQKTDLPGMVKIETTFVVPNDFQENLKAGTNGMKMRDIAMRLSGELLRYGISYSLIHPISENVLEGVRLYDIVPYDNSVQAQIAFADKILHLKGGYKLVALNIDEFVGAHQPKKPK